MRNTDMRCSRSVFKAGFMVCSSRHLQCVRHRTCNLHRHSKLPDSLRALHSPPQPPIKYTSYHDLGIRRDTNSTTIPTSVRRIALIPGIIHTPLLLPPRTIDSSDATAKDRLVNAHAAAGAAVRNRDTLHSNHGGAV